MDFSTTYNNTQELHEATGLIKFQKILHKQGFRYFPGICRWCSALTTATHKLQRCQGCQLVAYCGRECQRNDWGNHKILCKEFPAKEGKNILVLAQEETISKPRKNKSNVASEEELEAHTIFMAKQIERVQAIKGDLSIFMYPRMCMICCEARPTKLFDCICCAVVFCSETHKNKSKLHLSMCKARLDDLEHRALLIKNKSILKLPCILKEEIKIGNKPVDFKHLDELRKRVVGQLQSKLPEGDIDYEAYKKLILELQNIIINRLSFPLTIHNILQRLGVGDERKPLEEITSLNIHVLSDKPFVDSSIWEYFMHMIPNLKELHVTLVSHIFENSDWYMKDINLKRCKMCEKKDRVIEYTIYKNHYHMFFSSEKYTTPDVIAVFGSCVPSKHGLTANDDLHPELTWQNIMRNTKSYLIFTDQSEEALQKGVANVEQTHGIDFSLLKRYEALNGAKSLDEVREISMKLADKNRELKSLLPIQKNPLIDTLINGSKFMNFSKYISCYQPQSISSVHGKELNKINDRYKRMEAMFF